MLPALNLLRSANSASAIVPRTIRTSANAYSNQIRSPQGIVSHSHAALPSPSWTQALSYLRSVVGQSSANIFPHNVPASSESLHSFSSSRFSPSTISLRSSFDSSIDSFRHPASKVSTPSSSAHSSYRDSLFSRPSSVSTQATGSSTASTGSIINVPIPVLTQLPPAVNNQQVVRNRDVNNHTALANLFTLTH
jgi:hypothetical protein